MSRIVRTCAVLLLSLLATPALARDIEGTPIADTVTAEGKTLLLIGGGIRTKWMFSVYVGALYAEKPTFNAANLIKSDQIKRMELHMLRDVGKDKIVESITEGFDKQSKAQMPALKDRLAQLAAAVPDLKKGDVLTLSGKLAFRNWAQLGGLSRDGAAVRTFTVSIDDAAIRLD